MKSRPENGQFDLIGRVNVVTPEFARLIAMSFDQLMTDNREAEDRRRVAWIMEGKRV